MGGVRAFSYALSAGRWFAVCSRELRRFLETSSNHPLLGRHPRVAFFVAPLCRADRSCCYSGLDSWVGSRWGLNPDRSTTAAVGLGAKDRRRRSWDTNQYRVVKGFGFP